MNTDSVHHDLSTIFRSFWFPVVVALIVRLAVAPLGAHPGDLPVFIRWAEAIRAHGWLQVYAASDANYPPLGMALIALAQTLADLLSRLTPAADPGGWLWLVLIKLPAILADLLAMLVICHLGREGRALSASHPPPFSNDWRLLGVRGHTHSILLLTLALNPALIHLSAWWGQLDSVYAALALAALAAAMRRRPLWAGIALGASAMVKLQGLAVAPAVALALLEPPLVSMVAARRLAVFLLGAVISLLAGMLPFALTGQAELVFQRAIALLASPGWLTVNALNPWYLATGGAGNWAFNAPLTLPDSAPLWLGLSASTLGRLALAAWTAAVLALALRGAARLPETSRRELYFLAAALLTLGIFLWPSGAHERYALPAVWISAGAAAVRPLPQAAGQRARFSQLIWNSYTLYAIITIHVSLNLWWAAPPVPWLEGLAENRTLGMLIAALAAAAALWGMALLARRAHSSGRAMNEA